MVPECVEYREYNIRNPREWLALPLLVLLTFAGLVVTLKNWSWISNAAGILTVLVFALATVDGLKQRLVADGEGLHLRTQLRRRMKAIAWDSIEQVVVNRTRDGRAVRRVLIVGRHPCLPPEAVHREYDEGRGVLFEPPGRRIIVVPGSAPDLPAVLQCLQHRIGPCKFSSGICDVN